MQRTAALSQLVDAMLQLARPHPLRVAIDGIDAAGKTTLADELAQQIAARGRPVIRASIDGFHRPRAERYRQGADSPTGYYEDAFDYAALRDRLLLPLGPGGTRRFRRAVFDFRTDTPITAQEETAPDNAMLLMDGVFLLRPELVALWDYRIFVDARFGVALQRALQRDLALFGSAEAVQTRYQRRYMPAQQLYLRSAHPQQHADAVLQNDDPAFPLLKLR